MTTKERIYRSKIIAENHFKKDMQRYLDFYVAENNAHSINLTYKYIYLNYGLLHSILVKYNLSKLSNAMRSIGASCTKAANEFQKLTASLSQYTKSNKHIRVIKTKS